MNTKSLLLAVVTAASFFGISSVAKADTVNARCEFRPIGESRVTSSTPCTFSQRQGYIGIQTQTGTRYDFSPVGNQPGNFVDAAGNAVYRQSGLGSAGLIFQMRNESLYVYWDASSNSRTGTLRANQPGSRINVRSDATLYSRAIAYGLAGDRVSILECRQDTDTAGSNLNWCRVQFPVSRAIGWIRSDFISFSQ